MQKWGLVRGPKICGKKRKLKSPTLLSVVLRRPCSPVIDASHRSTAYLYAVLGTI